MTYGGVFWRACCGFGASHPRFLRKVVSNVGDIIIRDETMGQSWSFTPTKAGYAQAAARIEAITQQGHKVGGDVARVLSYTG